MMMTQSKGVKPMVCIEALLSIGWRSRPARRPRLFQFFSAVAVNGCFLNGDAPNLSPAGPQININFAAELTRSYLLLIIKNRISEDSCSDETRKTKPPRRKKTLPPERPLS